MRVSDYGKGGPCPPYPEEQIRDQLASPVWPTLADYFTGTGYQVEMEKDVARKRQLLDIVIIRATGAGQSLPEPCDGLEALRTHNLLTYKSGREPLDARALEELIGHYVNYRKSFAPREPVDQFGLYAVATRHPAALWREAG